MRRLAPQVACQCLWHRCHQITMSSFAEQAQKVFSDQSKENGLKQSCRHDYLDEFAQPLNKSRTILEAIRSVPLCTEVLINVPHNDNRLDLRTSQELLAALRGKRDGRALKALLLRGIHSEESNFFCGGLHWEALRENLHEGDIPLVEEAIRTGLKLVFFVASSSSHYLTSVSLPFLLSIANGRAESYGTALALYCDFACAMRTAEFVFNGPEYGLPVHGGLYRLLVPCNRTHPGVAQYLICTPGVPLYAADAMRLGLLQLRVSDQPELSIKELLMATGRWDYHSVAEALMHAQDLLAGEGPSDPCTLTEDRLKWIEECFGLEMDLERIIFNLEAFSAKHKRGSNKTSPLPPPNVPHMPLGLTELQESPSEWADRTLELIRSVSPTALKVSLELLRRTKEEDLSLSELLKLEFRAMMRLIKHHDFTYLMQKYDDLKAASTPTSLHSIRLKPMPRVSEEFQPNDIFAVTRETVDALLQPFDWDTEEHVDFDAINETWAEDDIVAHANRAQAEKRVQVVEGLGTNAERANDHAHVPVLDTFGEMAQLWTEMGVPVDVQDRTRWPNYLEHYKAFQYLFKETDSETTVLKANLQLYENLLLLDDMESQLAQQYIWAKWDRYLPAEDPAVNSNRDEDLVRGRFHQLYESARQFKQLQHVRFESTTDLREVPAAFLGTTENVAYEQGAGLSPSLEARLRYHIMLTSEVDMRVILNARTALLVELESQDEVPSQDALLDRLGDLVREEVRAAMPEALFPEKNKNGNANVWKPEYLINPEQAVETEDLTDAAIIAAGGRRPQELIAQDLSPDEKLALPMKEYFHSRIRHLMGGWPANQQNILAEIEAETAKRLKKKGMDILDPAVDLDGKFLDEWCKTKHEVMQKWQSKGKKLVLDVQPSKSLEELRRLWRDGFTLFPHEQRILWSGETTYPARQGGQFYRPPPIPKSPLKAVKQEDAPSQDPSIDSTTLQAERTTTKKPKPTAKGPPKKKNTK